MFILCLALPFVFLSKWNIQLGQNFDINYSQITLQPSIAFQLLGCWWDSWLYTTFFFSFFNFLVSGLYYLRLNCLFLSLGEGRHITLTFYQKIHFLEKARSFGGKCCISDLTVTACQKTSHNHVSGTVSSRSKLNFPFNAKYWSTKM